MNLKNMQDIGGCRIILSDEKKLRRVIKDLKKAKEFKHNGKYKIKDYIKSPKEDGYRSYHLIGKFPDENQKLMNIEIQLRTQIQHYWATALEIVDVFTDQALKSNQGDEDWKRFFSNASKQFAVIESIHLFNSLSKRQQQKAYRDVLKENKELFESFKETQKYSKKLKVVEILNAFSSSLKIINENEVFKQDKFDGYLLLEIDINKSTLTTKMFNNDDADKAKVAYIQSEKDATETSTDIVALVSTTSVGDIKEVYPNYFADSGEFRKYLYLVNSLILHNNNSFFRTLFSPSKVD